MFWSSTLEDYAKQRVYDWGKRDHRGRKDPDDYLPNRWHYGQELLFWNSRNAWHTFDMWSETNAGHEDQWHRRKMLSRDVTYMGAACWVKSNGQKYWLMILSNPNKKERMGIIKGRYFR